MRVPAPPARLRIAGALAALAAGFALASDAAPSSGPLEVSVRPGAVVRWSIEGVEKCGREARGSIASRTWQAVAGTCWYAIDLLEPAGALEVFAQLDGRRRTAVIRVEEYPYPEQRITLEDSSRVELSTEDLARVRREQSRVRSLWSLDGPARFELPLKPPLRELGSAGSFGSRRYFNDQPRSPHSGADFPAATGDAVLSASAGKVVLAADLFFSGQSVFVDHGGGLISMYFHLSSISVTEGDEVEPGEVVGRVGQTGRTTGPHLHFGLRWRGARVDPSLLLGPAARIPSIDERGGPSTPEGV